MILRRRRTAAPPLQGREVGLAAQQRQTSGERRTRGQRLRIDAGEMPAQPEARSARGDDDTRQRREQLALARGGIAGFEECRQ